MMFFNHKSIQLTFSPSLTEGSKRLVEQLGLYPRAGVSFSFNVPESLGWADRNTETDL